VPPDPRPVQPSTVLAAVQTAARGALPEGRSGQWDGLSDQTKGC
jgi:hypothetical protein